MREEFAQEFDLVKIMKDKKPQKADVLWCCGWIYWFRNQYNVYGLPADGDDDQMPWFADQMHDIAHQ